MEVQDNIVAFPTDRGLKVKVGGKSAPKKTQTYVDPMKEFEAIADQQRDQLAREVAVSPEEAERIALDFYRKYWALIEIVRDADYMRSHPPRKD